MESSKGVWSICRAWASEPAWATTSRTGSCPHKKARAWRKAAWSSTSMILTILVALMMSAFRKAQADESVMISLRSLFTGVRGIGILRTSPFGHSRKLSRSRGNKKGQSYKAPTLPVVLLLVS